MNEAALSVLVVEDDPDTADVIRLALESAGHHVRRVMDGRAALAALDEEWPHLLLLDRRLPDVDGLELCAQVRQLKRGQPYLPILMLTALQAPEQKATAFERGADDYLTKPFDVTELLARVRVWARAGRRVRELHELRQLYQQSQHDALTDPLTGMYNRRGLENLLEQETEKARRLGYALGLFVIDVDHFKDVNDSQGHLAGDRALGAVAHALRGALRRTDQLARFGGDEFVALLPGCDPDALSAVGEQLRQAVASLPQAGAVPTFVTVSIGGAVARGQDANFTRLLAAADAAVYRAKDEGRNRVVVADLATQPPSAEPTLIRPARTATPQDRRRADPLLRDLVEHAEPVLEQHGFHLDARGNSDERERSWVEFHRPDETDAPEADGDGEGTTVVQMGHRRRKGQLVVNAYHVDGDLAHKPHAKLLQPDAPEALPDVVGYVVDMVEQLPADGDAESLAEPPADGDGSAT